MAFELSGGPSVAFLMLPQEEFCNNHKPQAGHGPLH
jgi:hypothetical protein